MEASEVQELHEQHEKARENSLRHVSFTMSVLAVLVAIVTVMGHRTHTQVVLQQALSSDHWNLYQAKKIRQYNTQLTVDLLSSLPLRDEAATGKVIATYKSHLAKWKDDLNQEQIKAEQYQATAEKLEHRGTHYDIGEVLLEIALVITSITLLTRIQIYWHVGMAFGAAGIALAIWALVAG